VLRCRQRAARGEQNAEPQCFLERNRELKESHDQPTETERQAERDGPSPDVPGWLFDESFFGRFVLHLTGHHSSLIVS
jgi:hypothetical protein